MSDAPLALRLAQWVRAFDYEGIPAHVLELAKFSLLDAIGCAVAAPNYSQSARDILAALDDLPASDDCTVIGWKRRASVDDAVFVNGLRIRALDFNDHMANDPNDGSKLGSHPSDQMAVGLSVGEWRNASGRDVLAAMIMGYEIDGRMQKIFGRKMAWDHTTGTGLMAPAIAGRLMGLDEGQMASALGFGMTHALTPGAVRRGHLSAGKFLADPMIARMGVTLTKLAARGISGPVEIFEGDRGIAAIAFPGIDLSVMLKPMPKHYLFEGVGHKAFPSASTGQAAVTAALEARKQLGGGVETIERIEMTMADSQDVRWQLAERDRRYPSNQETADHSFHFLVAVALIDGELSFRQYANARWTDPKVTALMDKITITPDKAWLERQASNFPAGIKVFLRDGRVIAHDVPFPKGHPKNRFAVSDLEAKFKGCVAGVLDDRQRNFVVETVLTLEKQPSVRPLLAALAA
jgi:2-methylcitrate dehydratase